MVDIETLDTSVTAAILAIGAVPFDPRGSGYIEKDIFHVTCSKKDNLVHNRTVSEATERWWTMQSDEARQAVFDGPHVPLRLALDNFARWINRLSPTCTRIWAKSPDFDCAILIDAFQELDIRWPFKFWESRCCRTIMELAYPENDFPYMRVEGPKHDALADAKRQVLEVQHAYYVLGT